MSEYFFYIAIKGLKKIKVLLNSLKLKGHTKIIMSNVETANQRQDYSLISKDLSCFNILSATIFKRKV